MAGCTPQGIVEPAAEEDPFVDAFAEEDEEEADAGAADAAEEEATRHRKLLFSSAP